MLMAGNPDRQGEAGAGELLLNPWARSAGFHTLNTSMIEGVEAMRLNVAGLVRINRTQVLIAHTMYLRGSDISMNAVGLAHKVGRNGAFGISIVSMDFGETEVTTTEQPEGTGATYSPNFFHIGLSYSHIFENKISVGITARLISESTADLNAQGVAFDAGVQYVTGEKNNFKFGVSLRNVGTPMRFGGEGLSVRQQNPEEVISYDLTFDQRATRFELPSVLNIGVSYDFILNPKHRITILGNFISNSFSRDALGAGIEYSLNETFMIRAGYRSDLGSAADVALNNVYTGISAGVSIEVPFSKNKETKLGIDYAYRDSNPWNGTHNFSIRLNL